MINFAFTFGAFTNVSIEYFHQKTNIYVILSRFFLQAKKNSSLNTSQKEALKEALENLNCLNDDVESHVKGVHGSKIGGGSLGIIGGIFTIVGVTAFPPLIIPGIVCGAVGAATNITATIVDLSAGHQKRLFEIQTALQDAKLSMIIAHE